MNCLLKALAMSLGLMCVLSLKVIELLSCCGGRLCASPCIVFQYRIPHTVKHLINCPAHPTTVTQSDLWSRRELSYLEAG